MINNDNTITKISSFLSKEYIKNMRDISIFQNEDGSYEFFDRYTISEKDGRIIVDPGYDVKVFSVLKNAVAWCVHDNLNKFATAKRIEYLDIMISGAEVAIDMHRKMLKKSKDMEFTLIHLAKMNEEKLKRSSMLREMDGFITESKALQTKKFAVKR